MPSSALPITSFMFVWAFEFVAAHPEERASGASHLNKTLSVPLLVVIGAAFARFLAPNLCVQLRSGLHHDELRFLLHPALRCSLTMAFVFKLKLCLINPERGRPDSQREIQSLFAQMRATLLHIDEMEVSFDLQTSNSMRHNKPLRLSVLQSLPHTLLSLTISSTDIVPYDKEEVRILSKLYRLRQLQLLHQCRVTEEGLRELLRPKRAAAAAASLSTTRTDCADVFSNPLQAHDDDDDGDDHLFFPSLQRLKAATDVNNFFTILRSAPDSEVLPRLWEFDVEPRPTYFYSPIVEVDPSAVVAQLKSLAHVRLLGASVASGTKFNHAPPPLHLLRNVAKIGAHLFSRAEFNCGDKFTLDLSDLSELREIDTFFLSAAKGVKSVILPPYLKRVGRSFLELSSVEELDLAYCEAVFDVESFCKCSQLRVLDTAPLAGKVVGNVLRFCMDCVQLVEIACEGFAEVTRISHNFLSGCSNLVAITGTQCGFASVSEIGDCFCSATPRLTKLDLTSLQKNLQSVGSLFMSESAPEISLRCFKLVQAYIQENNLTRRKKTRGEYAGVAGKNSE